MCTCKELGCVQCPVRAVNSCFRCCFRGSFGSSCNQLHLTSAGRAAGWMETCGAQLPISHVADTMVCRAFPLTAELSLTAFDILQLQKNKKVHRIVAIKASAGYLVYECPYIHSILPVSQVSRDFETEQHTPLCWQCATTSLITTAKIPAPTPANC